MLGFFYIRRIIGIVSSYNWFTLWVFIELNSLCFIPFILKIKTKKGGEASLLYFVTQGIRSIFLMFALIIEDSFIIIWNETNNIILLARLLKLRAGFFFNWIYILRFILTSSILFIVITLQKIAPFLLLIFNQSTLRILIITFVLFSSLIGSIINLKQNQFKTIIRLSSLSNVSWFLIAAFISVSNWIYYFFIYTLTIILIFIVNNYYLLQNYKNKINKENLLVFLRMGGLPPLPGFFPKLAILLLCVEHNLIFLSFFLVLLTCVDLYVYLQFRYSATLNYTRKRIYTKLPVSFAYIFSILGLLRMFMIRSMNMINI